jgi:chromosome segregation ATPase
MLLSKALKMQQDLEDKRHEVIIENLENKIKEQSAAIEKKDFELQTAEGLLADAEAKITELNSNLLSQSENFEQEKLELDAKLEAEVQKSSELKESLTNLQNKSLQETDKCSWVKLRTWVPTFLLELSSWVILRTWVPTFLS